jgi:hypothetical protein
MDQCRKLKSVIDPDHENHQRLPQNRPAVVAPVMPRDQIVHRHNLSMAHHPHHET